MCIKCTLTHWPLVFSEILKLYAKVDTCNKFPLRVSLASIPNLEFFANSTTQLMQNIDNMPVNTLNIST